MRLPWPELPSIHRPDETVREILDYLAWIATTINESGYHTDAGRDAWRSRVQLAYAAMFLPPVAGHGDPYPPDVPPPVSPGIWPDVPAFGVPGMTVRHQLKVIALRAEELRGLVWAHARPELVAEWDRRVSLAREALDHGDAMPLPDEERTSPSEEILAEARAQEEAFKEHARKRAQRLQRMRAEVKKAAKAKSDRTAVQPEAKSGKATPEKAKAPPRKKPAPAASRSSAAKKKAASGKKAAPKKRAAPKKKAAPRKKAAPKKKAAPRKKAAPKSKATPKRKAATKASRAAATKKTKARAPKKKPARRSRAKKGRGAKGS